MTHEERMAALEAASPEIRAEILAAVSHQAEQTAAALAAMTSEARAAEMFSRLDTERGGTSLQVMDEPLSACEPLGARPELAEVERDPDDQAAAAKTKEDSERKAAAAVLINNLVAESLSASPSAAAPADLPATTANPVAQAKSRAPSRSGAKEQRPIIGPHELREMRSGLTKHFLNAFDHVARAALTKSGTALRSSSTGEGTVLVTELCTHMHKKFPRVIPGNPAR